MGRTGLAGNFVELRIRNARDSVAPPWFPRLPSLRRGSRPISPSPVIDKDLLEILCCPATRQPLAEASSDQIARANEAIRAGTLKTVGGEAVTEELEAALVREDGQVLYPIRDEIPVLLIDEGLPL